MPKAFTLIELLITLSIMSITAAWAIPSYQQHLVRVRRLQATVALLDLVDHYDPAASYLTDSITTTENGYYSLRILEKDINNPIFAADPIGTQAVADKRCGGLRYDHVGHRWVTGTIAALKQESCFE